MYRTQALGMYWHLSDYHLSLHRLQGDERFHLALDEFGRLMDVCRTGQRKTGLVPVSG
jgi:acid phosphatase type 7